MYYFKPGDGKEFADGEERRRQGRALGLCSGQRLLGAPGASKGAVQVQGLRRPPSQELVLDGSQER